MFIVSLVYFLFLFYSLPSKVCSEDDERHRQQLSHVKSHAFLESLLHLLGVFYEEAEGEDKQNVESEEEACAYALRVLSPVIPQYEEEKEVYDSYYQCVTDTYFRLIGDGLRPDEARSVLPNSLKASIMVSCSREEWKHIFSLRLSEAAHPDIRFVRGLVKNDRVQKGYLPNEEK